MSEESLATLNTKLGGYYQRKVIATHSTKLGGYYQRKVIATLSTKLGGYYQRKIIYSYSCWGYCINWTDTKQQQENFSILNQNNGTVETLEVFVLFC